MEKFEAIGRTEKYEQMHWDSQDWKSRLQLMQDEIDFIENLLNSYVFEPNTPNLFERLQVYKESIKRIIKKKAEVEKLIGKHESALGGVLECRDSDCDLSYHRSHERLKTEVLECLNEFQELKREVFNYAGGILKQRKP